MGTKHFNLFSAKREAETYVETSMMARHAHPQCATLQWIHNSIA